MDPTVEVPLADLPYSGSTSSADRQLHWSRYFTKLCRTPTNSSFCLTSCRSTPHHSSTLDDKAFCIELRDKEPSPSRQLDSAEHASMECITTSSIRALHGSPSTGLRTLSTQITVFHDFLLHFDKSACVRLTESPTSLPVKLWLRPQSRARNNDRGTRRRGRIRDTNDACQAQQLAMQERKDKAIRINQLLRLTPG